ncbi:MAG: prepilin-type N-terminal cleavage/methylation domain-containing protein [Mycoplasmatota bacterium]
MVKKLKNQQKKIKLTSGGFTLIELLAVLVILVVIAAIATPIVMGIINESKNIANISTVNYIVDTAEMFISNKLNNIDEYINKNIYDELDFSDKNLDVKVFVNNNHQISVSMYKDDVCYTKIATSNTVNDSKKNDSDNGCIPPDIELNGTTPMLNENLVPVLIDNNGIVTIADINEEWYSYGYNLWANAVTLNIDASDVEGSKSLLEYQNSPSGTIILEADIAGYYVWLPRYKYAIPEVEDLNNPPAINISFENSLIEKSTGDATLENYYTHPAFTITDEEENLIELNGFWVSKFELTGTSENPTFKPNITTIGAEMGIGAASNNIYRLVHLYNMVYSLNEENGFSKDIEQIEIHTTKNSEWGAIYYLTHSTYGVCSNGSCDINPSDSYTISANGDFVSNTHYSTTNNITGIYDLYSGRTEVVMGNYNNQAGHGSLTVPHIKYVDIYTNYDFENSINQIGHALYETAGWYGSNASISSANSWYYRYSYSVALDDGHTYYRNESIRASIWVF